MHVDVVKLQGNVQVLPTTHSSWRKWDAITVRLGGLRELLKSGLSQSKKCLVYALSDGMDAETGLFQAAMLLFYLKVCYKCKIDKQGNIGCIQTAGKWDFYQLRVFLIGPLDY